MLDRMEHDVYFNFESDAAFCKLKTKMKMF